MTQAEVDNPKSELKQAKAIRKLFPVPCSLFPVPCSLFPVPCSLFPVPCSLFPVPCSLFPVPCSLKPETLYLTKLKTAILVTFTF
ncbi:hypothetical protein [Moorena sp. SIO1F2]|uniref:hypothetical protein n=1 Tax=Moorena sp. SIO1F2 TaxID=2607819 RepID=UPI0025D4D8EE|nr:hypothetical protein [Moorena sp. SIO1F2]